MAHIRPYKPSDVESMDHIFRTTASPHLRAHPDPLVLYCGSYIWNRAYTHFYPSYCFVLDDGTGTAVGYILCAPDTAKYISQYQAKFLPIIEADNNIPPPPKSPPNPSKDPSDPSAPDLNLAEALLYVVHHPELQLKSSPPKMLEQYPAHLHIDILPSHQSQGWGPKLIETLIDKLKAENVPGVHLVMDAKNDGAGRFYLRFDFQRWHEVMDGGRSGRTGEDEYGVRFVRQIVQ